MGSASCRAWRFVVAVVVVLETLEQQHPGRAGAFGPPRPCVVYVTPPGWCSAPEHARALVDTCREAALGGAAAIQLRDRDATREELETATSAIRAALADAGCAACPVVVNGDVIDAAMAGADGVHLREQAVLRLADSTDLRALVARVRSSLARDGVRRPVVGCSAHSVYSVLVAARAGVDYVQIGTMFPTRTHPDKEDLEGPQLVKDAVAALDDEYVRAPLLVGVGGVTVDNCADVVRAGADGVAVIRSIAESADPKATVAALRTAMTGVSTRGGPASSSSRVKTPTAPPPASPPPPPTAAVSGASPGPPAGRESLLDTR